MIPDQLARERQRAGTVRQVTPAGPVVPPVPSAPRPALFHFVRGLARDLGGELDLPGFPDVVVRLHRTLGDQNCSTHDVVRLVSSEPALSGRLLQLANSAAFNPANRAVSNLKGAIALLGFNLMRSTATTFAMRQLQQQEWLAPLRPHLAQLWKESTAVAAICFSVARRVEALRADEALAAGLFHQIGSLYVLTRAHREGVVIGAVDDWADTISGWHPTIARIILEHWRLPEHLAMAVERQDALAEAGKMLLLPRLLAASKVYRVALAAGEQESPAVVQQLAPVSLGQVSFLSVVSELHDEIGAVSRLISG
jgi:HD-like signal output (HDOD) protein